MSEAAEQSIQIVGQKNHTLLVDLLRRLVKEKPLGTVGAAITMVLFLTAIFCDFLTPYGMNELHPGKFLKPPSAQFWLGTDNLGRDLFSRIIFGARVSVIVGLAATTISVIISTIIGILSGFFGGRIDITIQRFVDAFMCFPGLVFLIVAVTVIGPGTWQIIIALGLLYGIGGSRIVRGAVIGIKENVYIEAARAVGCPTRRLLTHHILLNVMAPIIILFTTRLPTMILVEASLSFLGLGIPPPEPTWGGMLSGEGRRFMLRAPWMAIWPGLALSIVVYGVNMFGDAVRDILDPRLRGGGGRYGGVKNKSRNREKE